MYPAGQENDLSVYFSDEERETALWAFRNHKRAGAGTDILSGAVCLYLTIRNKNNVYGVVEIEKSQGNGADDGGTKSAFFRSSESVRWHWKKNIITGSGRRLRQKQKMSSCGQICCARILPRSAHAADQYLRKCGYPAAKSSG